MTKEQETVSVVWVMWKQTVERKVICFQLEFGNRQRNVHTVILRAHLVWVTTSLLSQWGRWWLTGSSLRSRYFHTMKPDTFFSGQYFTTCCTTWSVSQWYMHVVKFSWCVHVHFHVFCELVCPCKIKNHKNTLAKFHFWVGFFLRYTPFWVYFMCYWSQLQGLQTISYSFVSISCKAAGWFNLYNCHLGGRQTGGTTCASRPHS